jgi:Family of unknown function (DUF5681)
MCPKKQESATLSLAISADPCIVKTVGVQTTSGDDLVGRRRGRLSMLPNRREYDVGYGKPPVATRWKPGQSGNPHNKRRKHTSLAAVVDACLAASVDIVEGDRLRTLTVYQAITLQLLRKLQEGDPRALSALRKYLHYADPNPERQREFIVIGGLPRREHDAKKPSRVL